MRLAVLASALAAGLGCAGTASTTVAAEAVTHARIDRADYRFEVRADLTYDETITVDSTLLTARGLRDRERSQVSFYPKTQRLDLVEAWVDEPDGRRVPVEDSQRFTRPSAASENAPGFVGSETTTVLFPQLRLGSRTHVVWRLTQLTPPLLGFNVWSEPAMEWATTVSRVDITAPESVPLHWAVRGGYQGEESIADGVRHVTAELRDLPARATEPNMVSPADFMPLFLATSLPDLESVGAIYHRQAEGRAAVTPEIAALAAKVVGNRQGLDAARAIYDWVTQNIRYVAVYLDLNDGWVPHEASAVLRNGFGDCKDHVVLMQAMLAARGIRAEAAIVQWGTAMKDAPLWQPGQFNHAIVYLPDWHLFANPTDPFARFDAVDGRLADKLVVIASEHGQVARTPAASPESHAFEIRSTINLGLDGLLVGDTEMGMSASIESSMRAAVAESTSPSDLLARFLTATPEGGFGTMTTSDPRDLSKPFLVSAHWTSPHGVPMQGREIYLTVPTGPNPQTPSRLRQLLATDGKRQTSLLAGEGDYTWSTDLTVPDAVLVASLPTDVDFRNSAGSYTAAYSSAPGVVHVRRRLVLANNVVQPEEYPALETLLYLALDDMRSTLVLDREDQAVR